MNCLYRRYGRAGWGRAARLAAALLLVVTAATRVGAQDGISAAGEASEDLRCGSLLQEAVAQLAAEQYPQMLQRAQDRMLLCPGPVSAFLVGLSQANLVDSRAAADPAQREQMRRSALRHLRVATAGTAGLRPRWQLTAHEWIVHLQDLGSSVARGQGDLGEVPPEDGFGGGLLAGEYPDEPTDGLWSERAEPLDIPPAPPPGPKPAFPWGPVVGGTLGLAALTTGIVMGVTASDRSDEAKAAARELLQLSEQGSVSAAQLSSWARQTRRLSEQAQAERTWAHGLLIGGGAALVAAGLWYWLAPPEGKWRWAAVPAGLGTTVRF